MKNLINRGSEWRKWDLHIHTPSSYDWDRGCKKTNSDIVDIALESGISAIAVTDHHNTESIDELKKLGDSKGLFVIPGVELRTDKGNKKIHIIGLFNPSESGKSIYDNILCPLGFSKDNVKKNTDEQIYCNFEDACRIIHEHKGIVFLHAGSKSNGIEQINSDLRSLLKTDLVSKVDLFEVNNIKNAEDYYNIVFPQIGRKVPCLITSDSVDRSKLLFNKGHSTEVIGKLFSWIKADLSFLGLCLITTEPKGRVYLGIEPPKISDIKINQTKYIDSIEISPIFQLSPAWFSNKLYLSHELTTIIGRKGSGKSALVDILALCGKSKVPTKNYSFLNLDKFRKISTIAKQYKANMKWLNKEEVSMNLADEVNSVVELEKVKYLPQSFVEQVCNEEGVSDLFQEEINKVIFSYVPPEKNLGTNSLTELITKKTEVVDDKIKHIRGEIDLNNELIDKLEMKQDSEYYKKINNSLAEKQKELIAIKFPKQVDEPKNELSDKEQGKLQKITKLIEKIEAEIIKTKEEQIYISISISSAERIKGKIQGLKDQYQKSIDLLSEESRKIGVDLSSIIKFQIDFTIVDSKIKEFKKRQVVLNSMLDENGKDTKINLYVKKVQLESEQNEITKTLKDSQKKYQEYLGQMKQIKYLQDKIQGTKVDKNLSTIISLKDELNYLSTQLDKDINEKYIYREDLIKELYLAISERVELYKEIYQPLIKFIEDEKKEQRNKDNVLTFDAGTVFNKSRFIELFLNYVNQGRGGSFQTKENGEKILRDIISKYSLKDSAELIDMINDILHSLNYDITKNPEEKNVLRKQLNSKCTAKNLYNFLSQLEYIDVRFKILFNGKDLNENEFSPGEKGALLLIFYLLIDKSNIPLIMDQPEENLDNESIYSLLVPYIKKAKENRQIIIVTHNPNLAVVCDSEQIICALMNKKNNEIRYESGSIEDLYMNKKIIDVLEGTKPAFTKREEKYF